MARFTELLKSAASTKDSMIPMPSYKSTRQSSSLTPLDGTLLTLRLPLLRKLLKPVKGFDRGPNLALY